MEKGKYKAGDKIRFIDEVGDGHVIKVISGDRLLIEDSNGFDYEIDADRVMLVKSRVQEEKAYNKMSPGFKEVMEKNVDSASLKRANEKFASRYKENIKDFNTNDSDVFQVDLHIHELIDSERGLSAGEKLDIQIAHFERMMNRAERQKIKRIVFIHGVGQGTLRYKIRELIDSYYPNAEYMDGSYDMYGYGATDVRFVGN